MASVQCCGNQAPDEPLDEALAWMGKHFSVQRNPNSPQLVRVSAHALDAVLTHVRHASASAACRASAFLGEHDWYREGSEALVEAQKATLNGSWQGQGFIENDPDHRHVAGPAVPVEGPPAGRDGEGASISPTRSAARSDWDHHRRAVQNLTMRIEKAVAARSVVADDRRPQGAASVTDLLEAPVLFISGATASTLAAEQKQNLKAVYREWRLSLRRGLQRQRLQRRRVRPRFPGADAGAVPRQRAAQAAAGSCRLVRPRRRSIPSTCRTIRSSGCGDSTPAAARA